MSEVGSAFESLMSAGRRIGQEESVPLDRDQLLQYARKLACRGLSGADDRAFWDDLRAAAKTLGSADAERYQWGLMATRKGWILAEVTLDPHVRRNPIGTVYRPHWDLGNTNAGIPYLNDGVVVLRDAESILPGETAVAFLLPLVPVDWGRVEPGQVLIMKEASKVVGSARVAEVHVRQESPGQP